MKNIRNFSIIAHINHGKSTLSDRIIQICGGITDNKIKSQILDSMDLERERGITIKAQSVTLNYKSHNNETYKLNFIDTPGHVDFSYEVSRSLAACEGALLVIDAGQGIEAQTIANYHIAIGMNLKVIPVLNKIDLPTADPKRIKKEIRDIICTNISNIVCCSAKTGLGVTDVLENLINNIPPPSGKIDMPLQALIIDSWFDNYLGVVSLIRIKNGILRKSDKIKVMSTGQVYNVNRLGIFTPKQIDCNELKCGEVGWLICNIKDTLGVLVGDTLTGIENSAKKALPNFKKVKPQIYTGLFPTNSDNYETFRNALNKLSLNDSSLFYEPDNSSILGFGFRCGFLGLLHMEIIQERLEREYNLDLIVTTPTVIYEVQKSKKEIVYINNPSKLFAIKEKNTYELREPIAECHILLPKNYLGNVISLCIEKRGVQTSIIYYSEYVELTYEIPMAEIILDFSDRLKSISHGYASLDYNFKRFQASKLVLINILINGECIDALSTIAHSSNALYRSQKLVKKMGSLIPRQQFNVTIQATVNNRIIASLTLKQLRKNVLTRCHGGDISRKRKLLQKQKEGKKRMKKIGNVELPQKAFLALLHLSKEQN